MENPIIFFILGNDFWAMGMKLDWTLLLKPLYLIWYFIGAKLWLKKVGSLMTIAAIISVEFEQGFQYQWNHNNFFGVLDLLVVLLSLYLVKNYGGKTR